jgi:hypothetical protein
MSNDPHGTGDMNEWSDAEFRMFEEMDMPSQAYDDPFVALMYDIAMFSPDVDYEMHVLARETLVDILRREYGFDFEAEFPWDEYKLSGESDA